MVDAPVVDAVVVGAGPNGLAAAIALAQTGRAVTVLEAAATAGGGARSAELTLPGYLHDVCSAVHPLAATSPFLGTLPLAEHGLEMVHPHAPLAHPLDGGRAVIVERSVEQTAAGLGPDERAYRKLIGPLAARWADLAEDLLAPPRLPRHPVLLARFGLNAVRSARALARHVFDTDAARALFAGIAAHSILPLDAALTASFGLALGASAHAVGWPVARGGSQRIAGAMAGVLGSLGGRIVTDHPVSSMDDVPAARAVLFDLSPRAVAAIAGDRLPASYREKLRSFRHGPGAFKLDWALSDPVPWSAPECARAATLHLGGTLEEIAASESAVARGEHPERPFVLLAQPSLFDPSRAPAGRHTLWAYCHTPAGSTVDMTERIEAQIERFAPGFRDTILARSTMGPADLERYNANYVGGDIAGGSYAGVQILARPTPSRSPYTTGAPGVYICSASTPPGAGVHGMCGYHAARAVVDAERRGA